MTTEQTARIAEQAGDRPRCQWHDVEYIDLGGGVLSCVLCATERPVMDQTYTAVQIGELLRPFGLIVGETTEGGLRIYRQPKFAAQGDLLTTQAERIAHLELVVQELTKDTRGDGERLSDTTGSTAADIRALRTGSGS